MKLRSVVVSFLLLCAVTGCTGEPDSPTPLPRYDCWVGAHLIFSERMTEAQFAQWYNSHVVTRTGPVCVRG